MIILIVVIIVLWVVINDKNAEIRELKNKIKRLEQKINKLKQSSQNVTGLDIQEQENITKKIIAKNFFFIV